MSNSPDVYQLGCRLIREDRLSVIVARGSVSLVGGESVVEVSGRSGGWLTGGCCWSCVVGGSATGRSIGVVGLVVSGICIGRRCSIGTIGGMFSSRS